MIKTKAAVLFNLNKPLKIIEFDLPNPQKGEILVKIHSLLLKKHMICGYKRGMILIKSS